MTAPRWRRTAAVALTFVTVGGSAATAGAATTGPRPTLTRLSTTSGRTAGGDAVTVHGNFRGAAVRAVYFGAARSTRITKGAGLVHATAPRHAAGWVNVRVVLADGRATPFVAADRYRYVAPPRITSVSPGSLLVENTRPSVSIRLTGSSFVGVTAVTLQGVQTHGYRVSADGRRLRLYTPGTSARPGVAPIVVTTRYGTVRSNAFTYRLARPTLTDPNGRTAGRVSVTVYPGDPENTVSLRMAEGTTPPATPTSGTAVKVPATGDVPLSIAAEPGHFYSLSAFARDRFGDYSAAATATVYVNPLSTVRWTQHGAGPVASGSPGYDHISCATASSCTAVEQNGDAYTWDGTSWSAASTVLETLRVAGLSCPTVSFCVAAGAAKAGGAAEWSRWDGTSWSSPIAIGGTTVTLSGLSCTSTTFCAATGESAAGQQSALTFDGTSWTATTAFGTDRVGSLSCVDPAFCMAVGTHAYRFDGTSWTISSSAGFGDGPVSCVSRTFCLTAANGVSLRFDGTSWKPVAPSTVEADTLSCASTTLCVAQTYDSQLATFDGTDWSAELRLGNSYGVSPACAPGGQCVVVSDYKGAESTYVSG